MGVGEVSEFQLFYYFVKSERSPEKDPVILWLTGGPGCSALSGFMFEIGKGLALFCYVCLRASNINHQWYLHGEVVRRKKKNRLFNKYAFAVRVGTKILVPFSVGCGEVNHALMFC